MLAGGFGDEVVARTMFAAREALKLVHKREVGSRLRGVIDARNASLYGWTDGPSFGDLRARYGSWTGVIAAACRPGGSDLQHLL